MNVLHRAHPRCLVCLFLALLILAILLPVGATLAQSGYSYRLKTVATPLGEGVSSGGAYVLRQIETWPSSSQSGGRGYFLAAFSPDQPANICVYLPLVLRAW